jgi:hypothetical protein
MLSIIGSLKQMQIIIIRIVPTATAGQAPFVTLDYPVKTSGLATIASSFVLSRTYAYSIYTSTLDPAPTSGKRHSPVGLADHQHLLKVDKVTEALSA